MIIFPFLNSTGVLYMIYTVEKTPIQDMTRTNVRNADRFSIKPSELVGYDLVKPQYMQLVDNYEGRETIAGYDNLAQDMFKLLQNNKLVENTVISNDMTPAQIRQYHRGKEDNHQSYLALEMFYNSLSPNQSVKKAIGFLGNSNITEKNDLIPDKLQKYSESMRNYIVNKTPLTPWVQVDITDPSL